MKEQFPYTVLKKQLIIQRMNDLAVSRLPFLFIIDYKAEQGFVIPKDKLNPTYIQFHFQTRNPEPGTRNPECETRNTKPGTRNTEHATRNTQRESFSWQTEPVDFEDYKRKFGFVQQQIHLGNSFLTNLTQPTNIYTNLSLSDLYELGWAKYKLWFNERFVVFSPETFVKIEGQTISSYPMKGTIDASIPNARELILNDPKEKAEHATIVDLIRNDLSLVANEVEVTKYRYVDEIKTNKKNLLQVSSEIVGQLPEGYRERIGDILFALLPAGSICGAPKQKTLQIIDEAEGYDRGFYTGICGWFDGENLDSAVMIRFIEQIDDKLIFKSGGGITAQSELEKEYEELIQKVYVPVR